METMNGPAVTEEAVARKRMREAMKTTSGDGDFYNSMNWRVEENDYESTNLEEKNSIFSAANRITKESGPRAFDKKKGIGNATKGL